jgi:hypothetical protein
MRNNKDGRFFSFHHSLTHLLTHILTHRLTHILTHILTYSLTEVCNRFELLQQLLVQ